MEYLKLNLTQIEPNKYNYAEVEVNDHLGHHYKKSNNNDEIMGWLQDFAKQEGISIQDLLFKSGKINLKYDSMHTYLDGKKNKIGNSRNEMKLNLPHKKTLAVKIGTWGVITIIGLSSAGLTNYVINRHNAYNNKYVVSMQKKDMSKELYDVLKSYSDFNTMFSLMANGDYKALDGYDISKFHDELDTILESNNKAFKQFYDGHGLLKEPQYSINLSKYFKEDSKDFIALKEWEDYYRILFDKMSNYKFHEFNDYIKYMSNIYIAMLYGAPISDRETKEASILKSQKYDINGLSPLAKYCIFKMGYPIIEMRKAHGTYDSSEESLAKASVKMSNFENDIKYRIIDAKSSGKGR